MKPIRLAILGTQGLPAKYGGYETFTEELATRLVERGDYEVSVYCPAPRGTQRSTSSYRGVQLLHIPIPSEGGLGNVLFDVACIWDSLDRYDIVYMLGYGAAPFFPLPRLFGARMWVNLDGLEWKRTKWSRSIRSYVRIAEWFCGQSAHQVICDARAIESYYRNAYRSSSCTTFIPYGAVPTLLPPDSLERLPPSLKAKNYCLVVARLEPENQVKEIIEGYLASSEQRPLVVVGGLDDRPYVKSILAHQGDRVRFLGGVYDKGKLSTLRAHAHVAFHGHTVGGTNPSLLEALAVGRPILAHDNPFNREVGSTILRYFKGPEDIPELLKDLDESSPEMDEARMLASRQHLQKHYTWEAVAAAYDRLARVELGLGAGNPSL